MYCCLLWFVCVYQYLQLMIAGGLVIYNQYIYIYICVCVCVYMYRYVCIYIYNVCINTCLSTYMCTQQLLYGC